jgi:hypothetical protein
MWPTDGADSKGVRPCGVVGGGVVVVEESTEVLVMFGVEDEEETSPAEDEGPNGDGEALGPSVLTGEEPFGVTDGDM